MAIPDYETLMLPLLRLLQSEDKHIRALSEALADEFRLTDDEKAALLPSGRGVTVIHSRTGWAKTYLKQAGLIAQPRRGWATLTDRGREVLAGQPTRVDNAFLDRFREFRDFRVRSRSEEEAVSGVLAPVASALVQDDKTESKSPEERLEAARREISLALASDLLARVRAFEPSAFEQLIVDLLVKMGFGGSRADAAARLGRSGDGGIDGIIREDALGLDAVYVQAKCWAADNTVGPDKVGEFFAALARKGASKGVFVTTSDFTKGAHEAHRELGNQKRIVLINGTQLAELMLEHEVGVRTVQTIRLQRLDLDTYEDDDTT